MYGKDMDMPDRSVSLALYDPSDDDLREVLRRCSDLTTFICQTLYPGADPTGHDCDPKLSHAELPPTLLWWLSSLRATLESLYGTLTTSPPDALHTTLQAYLAQHPAQASQLHGVLVEALERGFTQWDQVRTWIAPPGAPSARAAHRDEDGD
jgi:hypothetical protein